MLSNEVRNLPQSVRGIFDTRNVDPRERAKLKLAEQIGINWRVWGISQDPNRGLIVRGLDEPDDGDVFWGNCLDLNFQEELSPFHSREDYLRWIGKVKWRAGDFVQPYGHDAKPTSVIGTIGEGKDEKAVIVAKPISGGIQRKPWIFVDIEHGMQFVSNSGGLAEDLVPELSIDVNYQIPNTNAKMAILNFKGAAQFIPTGSRFSQLFPPEVGDHNKVLGILNELSTIFPYAVPNLPNLLSVMSDRLFLSRNPTLGMHDPQEKVKNEARAESNAPLASLNSETSKAYATLSALYTKLFGNKFRWIADRNGQLKLEIAGVNTQRFNWEY